jgi:hypothetical protein
MPILISWSNFRPLEKCLFRSSEIRSLDHFPLKRPFRQNIFKLFLGGKCVYGSYWTLSEGYGLEQGFSTFWYLSTPKSKLQPSVYPQIRVVSLLRTPKSKILHKWASFLFILRTPCELLTYPRLRTAGLEVSHT